MSEVAEVAHSGQPAQLPRTEPESMGLSPVKLRRAADYARTIGEELGSTGGAVVVARHGAMVGEWYWGRRAVDPDAAGFDAETMVPLLSVTKGLTATVVALLIEDGQLWLDEPAHLHLPELAEGEKAKITVRHLATHSSGFPAGAPTFFGAWRTRRDDEPPAAPYAREAAKLQLLFEPGTDEAYSNPGTALLGEIVYRVSGKTVPELVRERILEPLRLRRLDWDFDDELARDIALCVEDGWELTRTGTKEARIDGSVWAGAIGNARDLTAFGVMLAQEGELDGIRVMAPLTVRMMTTCQSPWPARARHTHRGLLWWIKVGPDSPELGHIVPRGTYCHGGAAHSVLVVMPDLDIVAVMLRNRLGDPPGFIYERDYPVFMDLVAASVEVLDA